ncbi:MAG: YdeI/OmpD-associated family protein [Anaerolineae bacterium]
MRPNSTMPSEQALRANPAAWVFFRAQAASYQRAASWWVVSAKKEETRLKRLNQLIAESASGLRLAQFVSPGKRR